MYARHKKVLLYVVELSDPHDPFCGWPIWERFRCFPWSIQMKTIPRVVFQGKLRKISDKGKKLRARRLDLVQQRFKVGLSG